MEQWKTYKLGELCNIHRGSSPRPIQKYLSSKGQPWVKISDATAASSRYISNTKECIIPEGIKHSVVVTPGTLIVSNSATPGLPKIMNITACVHDGWLIIDNIKSFVLKEFLYYSFILIRRELSNQANGSVFQNLKTEIVKNFEIKVPPLTIQHKIVNILERIEDKIDTNNSINDNLEQQAKALYKSWFVDFEPFKDGKFIESELGQIPEGWRIYTLNELMDIKRGSSPRPIQSYLSETGLKWLKISDATSCSSPFIYEIQEHIKSEGLRNTVYLQKGALVLSNSATPGLPKILGIDTCIHDGWLYFPISKLSNPFMYLMFIKFRENLISQANGSVFMNLKTEIVKNLKIALPKREIIEQFDLVISSVFNEIRNRTEETMNLSKQRDTLLPKLMSGEIKINEIDC